MPKKRAAIIKCCVPRCGESKTLQNNVHTIPKARLKSWQTALGIDLLPSQRVCSNHFKNSDYTLTMGSGLRRILKKNALPSPVPDDSSEGEAEKHEMDDDDKLRRLEILKDFDQVPADMKVLPEDMPALEEEVRNLLCYISSEECRLHAEHYIIANNKEHSSIWSAALGPFQLFPDLTLELYTKLEMYIGNKVVSPGFQFGKLPREVITWAIGKHRNCTRQEAEAYFEERNRKVEVDFEGLIARANK